MLRNLIIENKPLKKYSDIQHPEFFGDMIDLSQMTFDIPNKFEYSIIEVTEDCIARPDIISFSLYGDDCYADIICKLNGISNPFELNEGMQLIVPTPTYLQDFFIIDTFVEPITPDELKNNSNNNTLPVPKTKHSKRKANEAVIGDVRYKIDSDKKVIIY